MFKDQTLLPVLPSPLGVSHAFEQLLSLLFNSDIVITRSHDFDGNGEFCISVSLRNRKMMIMSFFLRSVLYKHLLSHWHSQQLACKHSGTFSSYTAWYFPQSLEKTKTELEKSEYWTGLVATNTTPNECLCCSVSAKTKISYRRFEVRLTIAEQQADIRIIVNAKMSCNSNTSR